MYQFVSIIIKINTAVTEEDVKTRKSSGSILWQLTQMDLKECWREKIEKEDLDSEGSDSESSDQQL